MSKPLSVCLWFEGSIAQEAAEYYCSIFKDSKITESNPMVTLFELNGSKIMALNGNSQSKFNESASIMVYCDTQEEIDHYWNADGGNESMCGWLKDKYGVSWQIVPSVMGKLMSDPNKFQRVIEKVMQMKKLIIADMENA
jgi:predicted 3-demethylubiquinone-9 3-methyltransferase (glyoxalase superfamily)